MEIRPTVRHDQLDNAGHEKEAERGEPGGEPQHFARAEVSPKRPPSFFRGGKNVSAGILVQSDLFT